MNLKFWLAMCCAFIIMIACASVASWSAVCKSTDSIFCPSMTWIIIDSLLILSFIAWLALRLWLTEGEGETPPFWARLFGRMGRNMDGHSLLTWQGQVWLQGRYDEKWLKLNGG
jgi:hypothetical protein